jgi:pimeloyl-ACP methyl ester carboxylesterase
MTVMQSKPRNSKSYASVGTGNLDVFGQRAGKSSCRKFRPIKLSLPYLLLLPGLACDKTAWLEPVKALSGSAEVRIADYGDSDSIGEMARMATEKMPGKFAVAGHSMGGRIAFEIMRQMPERVTQLAVLDTAYRGWTPGEAGEKEKAERFRWVELAKSQGMRAMAWDWVQGMVHPSRLSDAPLIESIIEMFARKTPAIFARQINALLNRPDATQTLREIRCPTMVLCGREDTWGTLAMHQEISGLISGSKLVVVENCGHMCTMERPRDVNAALVEWFRSSAS